MSRKREYENRDIAAFCRRMTRTLERRIVRDGDVAALADLLAIANEVEAAAGRAARALVDPAGANYSWADVGAAIGIARSGAHRRFGTDPADHRADDWNADRFIRNKTGGIVGVKA